MDLILTHILADFDALASAVLAARLYPGAKLLLPGSPERNVREYLKAYSNQLPPRISSRDLHAQELEKIILVDVSDPERLGECQSLLEIPTVEIIRYDHHEQPVPLAFSRARNIFKPYGANSTLLVEELQEKGIQLTPQEATLGLLGVYEETGSLTYTSTRPEDLQAAASLLAQAADLSLVPEFIQRSFNAEQQALFQALIHSRETRVVQGWEISLAHAQTREFVEDMALVVNKIKELENLTVLFAAGHMAGRTYLVARSTQPEIPVGRIFTRLGGGGHATAASAVLKETRWEEVCAKLLEAVAAEVLPALQAAQIMSSPVVSVQASARVAEALRMMQQYGHSGLPVLEEEKWAGLVIRTDLDQALHHGLENVQIRQFMRARLTPARSTDSLPQIQRLMSEQQIHHLPVVEGERLLGIITQADLLRH